MGLFLEHSDVTDQKPSHGNISKPAGKTSNNDVLMGQQWTDKFELNESKNPHNHFVVVN